MGCQTNDAIREAFINSCFFAKEEKENNSLLIHYGNHYKTMISLIVGSKLHEKLFMILLIEGFILHFLFVFFLIISFLFKQLIHIVKMSLEIYILKLIGTQKEWFAVQ
jgi:nitrate reductase gamma subunit